MIEHVGATGHMRSNYMRLCKHLWVVERKGCLKLTLKSPHGRYPPPPDAMGKHSLFNLMVAGSIPLTTNQGH